MNGMGMRRKNGMIEQKKEDRTEEMGRGERNRIEERKRKGILEDEYK
jgi:hypothetical protein